MQVTGSVMLTKFSAMLYVIHVYKVEREFGKLLEEGDKMPMSSLLSRLSGSFHPERSMEPGMPRTCQVRRSMYALKSAVSICLVRVSPI